MSAGLPVLPGERRRAPKGSGYAHIGRAHGETHRQSGHLAATISLVFGLQARKGATCLRCHPETSIRTVATDHSGTVPFSPKRPKEIHLRTLGLDEMNSRPSES
jgi:hypothetical protein